MLSLAQHHPVMSDQLEIVHERDQFIPGSVQYSIRRFRKDPKINIDDTGMMAYHFKEVRSRDNFLELLQTRFDTIAENGV